MNAEIRFYLVLVYKRLPAMLVIFLVFAGGGIGMAITMPPVYVADAKLLVEGAQIPDDMAASTVRTEATEQLQIIEQRLMTRNNLIDIAGKYRVFAEAVGITPDAIVEQMRRRTEIKLTTGRDAATTMEISFRAGEARVAAGVVNELVTLVLTADAARRQDKAVETLDFFEKQVEDLSLELSRRSAEIVTYKEANRDALPEGLDYRMNRQSFLQERLGLAARDIAALQDQRKRLVALGSAAVVTQVQQSPEQRQLSDLHADLNAAVAVYSESNPRVILLRKRIEALEAQLGALDASTESIPASTTSPLQLQLDEIDSRVAFIDNEVKAVEAELASVQEAIERTPKVSIRLDELEREYENAQTQYNRAVEARAKARTGELIEVSAKGERVSVIEQAVEPTEPDSPNRKLIAGGGVFVGSALAALFFTLTELLNKSIRRPVDLTRGLGVQPLATIPYIEEEGASQKRQVMALVASFGIVFALAAGLWAVHAFYMPLDLLFEKVMTRVGN